MDVHSKLVLNGSHLRVYVILLELVKLRAVDLEVDRGPVLWIVGLQFLVHARDALTVAVEDGVLEQETQCGHFGYEYLAWSIHLQQAVQDQ